MNRQLIGILFLTASIHLCPGTRPETVTSETRVVPAAASASDEQPKPARARPPLEEIIVVVKTHFDIGYTHRVRDIVNIYRTSMITLWPRCWPGPGCSSCTSAATGPAVM